jgi:Ca2+-dependent lipid-binding protein
LKDKDAVGQSDPFVEVYIDKKYKQRTTTQQNTQEPVWNERFTFNLHGGEETIHFNVYDADVGDKDSIGNGKVKLKHVFDDGQYDDWVKLPAHLGLSVHGELHVVMKFTVIVRCTVVIGRVSLIVFLGRLIAVGQARTTSFIIQLIVAFLIFPLLVD